MRPTGRTHTATIPVGSLGGNPVGNPGDQVAEESSPRSVDVIGGVCGPAELLGTGGGRQRGGRQPLEASEWPSPAICPSKTACRLFRKQCPRGPPWPQRGSPEIAESGCGQPTEAAHPAAKSLQKHEFSEIIWLQPGTARIGQNGFSGQLPQDRQTSLPNWPSACDFSYDLGPHNIQEIQSNPAFSLIAQRIRMTIAP